MSQGRVLTRSEASKSAAGVRTDGLTVVFTNGCFDLLHPGHLHILRAARSLGDFLMVGVNTDASVGRLKGPGRPLLPLAARMDLLAELRCVDGVVPFDEDTPMELIREVRPAVLVKGGDYSSGTVVGADLVTSLGGRVVIVPLLGGYSTTSLAEALPGQILRSTDPMQGGGGS